MAVVTAARPAHEALIHARFTASAENLSDLTRALLTMGRSAPAEQHLPITTVHALVEDAAEALAEALSSNTPGTFTAKKAARARVAEALDSAEHVIRAVDPSAARPFRGTDMPVTLKDIVRSALAYNPADLPTAQALAFAGGQAAVLVYCRSDNGTGRRITAVIGSGIDTAEGWIPAHPPLACTFTRVNGRKDAADNARRVLAARIVAEVPVRWVNDPRP
ncbi:hypothetical protein [Streptomyces niveus]|uniref:hypothetical protein n=1 Tax=Streptomyces niveus TaxID=193462 RepID=UPI00342CCC77